MKAKDVSKPFPLPAAGPCPARLTQIIDMGTSTNPINGKDRHQIFMGFECPTRTYEKEEKDNPGVKITVPHIVGTFFTLSLSPKANLRQFLESWLGRTMSPETAKNGFDMKLLHDKVAYISIMHDQKDNGDVKPKISTIMPCPPEIICPPRVTSLVYFSLDPEEFSAGALSSLTNFFQEKIRASHEWAELTGQPTHATAGMAPAGAATGGNDGFDDDIPF
jgi:hypothetical protein